MTLAAIAAWALWGGMGAAILAIEMQPVAPTEKAQETTSSSDVARLIEILKPLLRDPNSNSEYQGLGVTFTAGGAVIVRIKLKNGNEYQSKGDSLIEAARTIDSVSVRQALQHWEASAK